MRYARAIGRAVMVLTAMTALAGCTTSRISWEKPGIAQGERERDENACLRAAISAEGGGQLLSPVRSQ